MLHPLICTPRLSGGAHIWLGFTCRRVLTAGYLQPQSSWPSPTLWRKRAIAHFGSPQPSTSTGMMVACLHFKFVFAIWSRYFGVSGHASSSDPHSTPSWGRTQGKRRVLGQHAGLTHPHPSQKLWLLVVGPACCWLLQTAAPPIWRLEIFSSQKHSIPHHVRWSIFALPFSAGTKGPCALHWPNVLISLHYQLIVTTVDQMNDTVTIRRLRTNVKFRKRG